MVHAVVHTSSNTCTLLLCGELLLKAIPTQVKGAQITVITVAVRDTCPTHVTNRTKSINGFIAKITPEQRVGVTNMSYRVYGRLRKGSSHMCQRLSHYCIVSISVMRCLYIRQGIRCCIKLCTTYIRLRRVHTCLGGNSRAGVLGNYFEQLTQLRLGLRYKHHPSHNANKTTGKAILQ